MSVTGFFPLILVALDFILREFFVNDILSFCFSNFVIQLLFKIHFVTNHKTCQG